jgi:DNA-binding transcriptional ArsR family regulator
MTPRLRTAGFAPVDPAVAAIADPARWQLLNLIATRGEETATTLAAQLPVSRPAVAKHLSVLSRAGLVRARKSGREVRYRVQPDRLEQAARWMTRLANEWDTRLAAIKRIAESLEDE